ncbi:DUF2919 domain-containing protein [Erwinia pyrifoliae]|uniref:DUF2919 domain-containing protein n=1 Tax=Erwinia pyrifoliae TaxID=79967 RepID=UPI0021FEDD02|nr:DUF2919 domain-containing protein [Erwinia pyrifoliae]UWS31686.1 DUF2919 domain-containing protein [Erwinia pyrifoliae]UXK11262.1 DUF2919 domain-containing protein [Erwinia pyrifoliae]
MKLIGVKYLPDDYDSKGQLRLPLSFWAILLLQARTWLLFVMAGASGQQGSPLLELFYPDNAGFWLGLCLGVPAALGLLLTGYRQRLPRLWQAWRWVLLLSLLLALLLQFSQLWHNRVSDLLLLTSLADGTALLALLYSRRLRDCFDPAENH